MSDFYIWFSVFVVKNIEGWSNGSTSYPVYSSLRAGIWFFLKTFENHGSISSMGIVNFLITMVINKNTGNLIFFYNHGFQPLIPGDKGFGATF